MLRINLHKEGFFVFIKGTQETEYKMDPRFCSGNSLSSQASQESSKERVVFGGYSSGSSGHSFLFSLFPRFKCSREISRALVSLSEKGLGFGGDSPEEAAIWLDKDLFNKTSANRNRCKTYSEGYDFYNLKEDGSPASFKLEAIEVWVEGHEITQTQFIREVLIKEKELINQNLLKPLRLPGMEETVSFMEKLIQSQAPKSERIQPDSGSQLPESFSALDISNSLEKTIMPSKITSNNLPEKEETKAPQRESYLAQAQDLDMNNMRVKKQKSLRTQSLAEKNQEEANLAKEPKEENLVDTVIDTFSSVAQTMNPMQWIGSDEEPSEKKDENPSPEIKPGRSGVSPPRASFNPSQISRESSYKNGKPLRRVGSKEDTSLRSSLSKMHQDIKPSFSNQESQPEIVIDQEPLPGFDDFTSTFSSSYRKEGKKSQKEKLEQKESKKEPSADKQDKIKEEFDLFAESSLDAPSLASKSIQHSLIVEKTEILPENAQETIKTTKKGEKEPNIDTIEESGPQNTDIEDQNEGLDDLVKKYL